MPDNFINPDDATEPVKPRPPYSQPPQQQPQGKLVLGNFDKPQASQPRRPYQYPPQPQPQQPPYPRGVPPRPPQGPYTPPNQPGHTVKTPPQPQSRQPGPYQPAPTVYPDSRRQNDAGKLAAGPRQPVPTRKPRRRNKGCAIGCGAILLILLVVIIFGFITVPKVLAFGSAISTEPPLSSNANLLSTSTRTNLLVMGYGGGSHDGANLTDSMVVMSVLPQSQHTSIISVPRDLWVNDPTNPGQQTKLNSVYEFASNNGQNIPAGGAAAIQKVSSITGLNVQYWLTIDFTGFKKVIDSIGGVTVNVPDTFNACYPNNDDASVDASWKLIQFNKGTTHMNGEEAIEFARAREPAEVCGLGTSENLAELTDFARSARQQIIIKAVLSAVKQYSTWPHLFDAMSALQQTIHTNMSLTDLSEFALKMNLNDPKTAHIGLSNQNVLQDSQTSDGQYILIPQNGDWTVIPPYIQQQLYK